MNIRGFATGLLMSGVAFAAAAKKAENPDLITQVSGGFTRIISGGDLGLQIAVVILFVAGFALGWWKEAHGGF